MGLVVRGESWKRLGAAFHDAEIELAPPPGGQYVVLSTCNRKDNAHSYCVVVADIRGDELGSDSADKVLA